ncbi:MAG: YtxH domain-containing protein [Nitrospirae bacterium]|nr:YtxH domain-containing protein [Nitrospirota bacterium]
MSRDENTALVALFSFLAGGLVGAGVALLLAPQSGKKTRKQIREFADDVKEQASEYAEKVKEKVF